CPHHAQRVRQRTAFFRPPVVTTEAGESLPRVGHCGHGRVGTRLAPGRQREEPRMAKSPEENNAEWAEAFNAGDGEALLALYDPEAKFVMPTGDVLEGVESIGQALGGFFALKPQIDLRTERVLRCGDTAISNGSWT